MWNDVEEVDVDTLLDICYATLFTLHNHVSSQTFAKQDKLSDAINYYFRDVCKQIGDDKIGELIANSFISKYNGFKTRGLDILQKAFLFLHRSGLITMTPVLELAETIPSIYSDLKRYEARINYKDDLFKSYNICIKYPMFYIAILKDILGKYFPEHIPSVLLGSIVKCHVRGILPEDAAFEFCDSQGYEVDYVSVRNNVAVEISIANKQQSKLNFKYLGGSYWEIVLTKDIYEVTKDGMKRPYHEFIQVVSDIYSSKKDSVDILEEYAAYHS